MFEAERTRKLIGIYVHIGDAEHHNGAMFCTVYAVGDRLLLGGLDGLDDIAALFNHIRREQFESMVQAVASGSEKVA